MKGRTVFSKRLVMVYTLIAALPFGALIGVATDIVYREQERKLITNARQTLQDNIDYVSGCIESFYQIESIIVGNTDMAHFFLFGDRTDTLSVISYIRSFTNELERLPVILPQLYGVRLFMTDTSIPERWPIFFHEQRLSSLPPLAETWRYNYPTESMYTLEIERNMTVSYMQELRFNRRLVGYIQILMRMGDFFPFLYKHDDSGSRAFVCYRHELFMGSTRITDFEKVIPLQIAHALDAGISAGDLKLQEAGKSHILVWRRVPGSDLVLVQDCSLEQVQQSRILFRAAAGGGILGSLLVLFVIIRFVTQKMMFRLYRVIEGMKQVRRGTLDIQLAIDGTDEIADMAFTFNSMTARLTKLIAEIKAEQQLLTDTEIKAMQNQINAHFLYNVLETIKMQAEVADQQDIVQSITLLGKMMRYCLRRNMQRVALAEELEYVKSYIALLNIRNDYIITLHITIEESLSDYQIPKMLIQPLVENAFLYAIEPLGIDGEIGISAKVEADMVWIEVQDHGKGISPAAAEKIQRLLAGTDEAEGKNSIGIQNIQQRLTAFYGDFWKLQIISAEGSGTLVRVPLPLNPQFTKGIKD